MKEVFLQPDASSSVQVHWVYLWEYWVCYYFVILGLSEQMFWSQDLIKRPLKPALVLPCNLSSSNKSSELLTDHIDGNGRTEIIVYYRCSYEYQLTTCGEREKTNWMVH